mmetsp:Transcript_3194/g.7862  ORF Transcript_3194/g.7862 Transcript_3194/m.7862 type:complete len:399 (-) Transcript_3194:381-1577(-)|eukprot:CAMPEP_0181366774 /NCGR_PEP_ID=MMETSP1106-20121128/10916_1 /TAXON_ID=81844 /ORGANISM="Mantoniella antarctica, Strain SL-175" /LENGTH=398 /DNA_ID=CAMNT_0023482211 /DNA_START=107 /DNA_END=1303 /DNA_ORIENTATION=+
MLVGAVTLLPSVGGVGYRASSARRSRPVTPPGAGAGAARGVRAVKRPFRPLRVAVGTRASVDGASPAPPAVDAQDSAEPASATQSATAAAASPPAADAPSPKLACPICLQPFAASAIDANRCLGCDRTFPTSGGVADLCLDANGAAGTYVEPQKSGTRLFQSDVISGVYENGWRQSFAWAGFPGEEEETRFALDYMRSAAKGGVVLDVSCGSGLFSRRFAASGEFAHVVASDFSDNMMKQARAYCQEDPQLAAAMGESTSVGNTKLSFVRADVGRLPFATGSLDAVHAGAAMHCWPSPAAAVAEISRVLKPGGVFVASTFLDPTAILGDAFGGDAAVQPLSALFRESGVGTGGAFNQFWTERELMDLTTGMCGLVGFERQRSRQFILFKVSKPARANP